MMPKDHAEITLRPRALRFELDAQHAKYWLDECPIKTYYANAVAIMIPAGEKFFIRSIRAFLPQIQDLALKQQVKTFIQQEANHSREFDSFLQHHIFHHYPQLKLKIRFFPLFGLLALFGRKKMCLSLTVLAEHFTAVIAGIQLSNPEIFKGISSEIASLWQWHCIEEIEHKAVAFDVLKHCGYPYALRLATFMLVAPFILGQFIRCFYHMIRKDQFHHRWDFHQKHLGFIKKNAPLFWRGFRQYCAFVKPSFHPWQQDNRDLITQWEKKLPNLDGI